MVTFSVFPRIRSKWIAWLLLCLVFSQAFAVDITSSSLAPVTYGATGYSQPVAVINDTSGSYTYSTTGTLPGDFAIDLNSGVVSGTSTGSPSIYNFTVTVDNGLGDSDTAPISITVNQRPVSITGLTAGDKQYDGSNAATISGTATVNGADVIGADDVTVSGTPAGTFATSNFGVGQTVTITGLTLGGAQVANYSLAAVTDLADIAKLPINVTANDTGRAFGAANPTLTSVFGAFVDSDPQKRTSPLVERAS